MINNVDAFCYSDEEKANCLNDYFAWISTVDDSNTVLLIFEEKYQSSLSNVRISIKDIECLIGALNVTKAVGPDRISHTVLKKLSLQALNLYLCFSTNN